MVCCGVRLALLGASEENSRALEMTGKELWVARLEADGHATPMTFLGERTGKQFLVIAAGGSGFFGTSDIPEKASDTLDAFALPDN